MKKLPIELQNSDSFLGIVEHAGNSYAVIEKSVIFKKL